MVTTRLYCAGALTMQDFPVDSISDHISEPDSSVWGDFESPTAQDLAAIEEELSLHPLAVEDAVNAHQRPKVDRYDTHLFLAVYALRFDPKTSELTKTEVRAFITPHALITVHEPAFDMSAVKKRWDENKDLARFGVSFLLWGLLDVIVDGHLDAVQLLDAGIDSLEDNLFENRPHDESVVRKSFELRKSLVELRRSIQPMREVLNAFMQRDAENIAIDMRPYYQDLYDHAIRSAESADALRDLVATILETNLSIQSNNMNLVMKKVTSWAAIIAVPTAITGFFGQNLKFIGFGTTWGVWFSLALIAGTSVSLYISFKKRDWL
ncbi:magnesium transporter CorA family protein [Lacisediminihabitans changchengi]|uniref:Magnesium transporter CorA family protein n=1 Tax=Lacisediminihabitans changchengi TaxID=2787634 RepID=A0A934SJD9_9MICO|nr:magnesium transporter CorA family protein [Lacisediminihabitans changchengi]MBK4346375.1 magnesium transporter CorA family protein [Lacisediminihabitans changchengi]